VSGAVSKAVLVTGCSSVRCDAGSRACYRVTAGARMILVTRAITTDRGWDRVVRTAYPPPKPEPGGV
jgi:hypothetical protein